MTALALTELWTARLAGVALLLQTLEFFQIARVLRDDGVWSFSLLAREHRALPTPLRWLFAILLPYRAFMGVLALRGAGALLLLASNSLVAVPLFVAQIATSVRFRGTFNGGSDSMTALLLLTLCVARLAAGSPWVVTAAFVYLAVQTSLSYFVAGIAKLRDVRWRSGEALSILAHDRRYFVPRWLAVRLDRAPWRRLLAAGLLAFECSFPLALSGPRACEMFVALGLVFHVANSRLLGLNRFLFAWAAAYPALLFTAKLW